MLEYAKNSSEKIDDLQNYYDSNDWEDYSIRTHAVKSTSKMIGATDLYETARSLEEASKNKDLDSVNAKHSEFIERYKQLMDKINMLLISEQEASTDDMDEDVIEFDPAGDEQGGDNNE